MIGLIGGGGAVWHRAVVSLDHAAADSGHGRVAGGTASDRWLECLAGVILYAATGRWLQRKYLPVGKNSEAVSVITWDEFLGTLNLAPLCLVFYGGFYPDYQLRTGIDCALPCRLERQQQLTKVKKATKAPTVYQKTILCDFCAAL